MYICLDALGIGLLNNVLRAASKVTVPALINLLAFYVVGLPLGGLLAFGLPELAIGLPALWVGLDVGMATMCVGLVLYFRRLDWDTESKLAQALASDISGGDRADDSGGFATEDGLVAFHGTPVHTMMQSVGPALVRALEFNKQSDTWVYFLTAFNWYCISNIIFFVAMLFYIAAAFAWVWMDFVLEPDELDRMDTLTSLCVIDCTGLRLFLDTASVFACTVHPHAREPMRRVAGRYNWASLVGGLIFVTEPVADFFGVWAAAWLGTLEQA